MTQTTPTPEQIAARLKRFGDPSNDYGIYPLTLEKHEAKAISDHIEALVAQLTELDKENDDLAEATNADARRAEIACKRQQQAEDAAASARETALDEAKNIAHRASIEFLNDGAGPNLQSAFLTVVSRIEALKSTPAPVTPSEEQP